MRVPRGTTTPCSRPKNPAVRVGRPVEQHRPAYEGRADQEQRAETRQAKNVGTGSASCGAAGAGAGAAEQPSCRVAEARAKGASVRRQPIASAVLSPSRQKMRWTRRPSDA